MPLVDVDTSSGAPFVLILSLLVIACDRDQAEKIIGIGKAPDVTVLTMRPITISPQPLDFKPDPPLVVGRGPSGLCLTLKGGLMFARSELLTREYNEAMHGVAVTVKATTTSNDTIVLNTAAETWSKEGRVTKGGELAACMRAAKKVPPGTKISKITVTGSSTLELLGAYWETIAP